MRLKEYISSVPVIGRLTRLVYRFSFGESDSPVYWINELPAASQIVQIGSNDGKQGDPVFELLKKHPKWKAIFVEPVPYLFERLKENYGSHSRYIFVNEAINDGSQMTFYYVSPEAKEKIIDLPYWFDQLGSFDKNHILKHLNGTLAAHIRETKINGCTLHNLLERFHVDEIDLLHIDTEGYDWKILSQLDFSKIEPRLILFESEHLMEDEIKAALSFLNKRYKIYEFGADILAVRKKKNAILYFATQGLNRRRISPS